MTSTEPVTVTYKTVSDTAAAYADYTPVSGTITFNPDQTIQIISVPVVGDKLVEVNETFFIFLTNPINAQIVDDKAACTIIDDDFALFLPFVVKP